MVTYREIATITCLIPGFSSERDNSSIKDIKVAIDCALKSLKELKQGNKRTSIRTLIEYAETDIYGYEESLYDQDRIENFSLMEDMISFVLYEFSATFGITISENEYLKLTKKANSIFFCDDEYGTILDTKTASKHLINFLVNYLSGKFVVNKTRKKIFYGKLNSIRGISGFVSKLEAPKRTEICKKYKL